MVIYSDINQLHSFSIIWMHTDILQEIKYWWFIRLWALGAENMTRYYSSSKWSGIKQYLSKRNDLLDILCPTISFRVTLNICIWKGEIISFRCIHYHFLNRYDYCIFWHTNWNFQTIIKSQKVGCFIHQNDGWGPKPLCDILRNFERQGHNFNDNMFRL